MLIFAQGISGYQWLIVCIAFLIVLILSIVLHEVAHGYVAYKQGDDTAKIQGRLSLNPLVHFDTFGFICCMFFGFGWAKPVPVNPLKFRNFKKGTALVSIAGVTVNIILAVIFSGLYVVIDSYLKITNYFYMFLYFLCYFGYILNIGFFVFNLLPIYPLDGFNLIATFTKYDNKFIQFMRQYGSIILIVIFIFCRNILGWLMNIIGTPLEMFWRLIF